MSVLFVEGVRLRDANNDEQEKDQNKEEQISKKGKGEKDNFQHDSKQEVKQTDAGWGGKSRQIID